MAREKNKIHDLTFTNDIASGARKACLNFTIDFTANEGHGKRQRNT